MTRCRRNLLCRFDLEQNHIFRSGVCQHGSAQEFKIIVIVYSAEGRGPVSGDRRKSFAHAAEKEQLKTEQTGKRLQFDQARNKPIAHRANSEIHHQKVRMRGFIRYLQAGGNGGGSVARKFRCARFCYNLVSRAYHLITKFARQKNRCFRNPEIGWPLLGFVYAAQEASILLGAEVGVEACAKLGMHCFEMANDECLTTKE